MMTFFPPRHIEVRMNQRAKALLVHCLLSFVPAWGLWEMLVLHGWRPGDSGFQAMVLAGAFCPALATFVVRKWVTREGFSDMGLKPAFFPRPLAWLAAWLHPLGAVLIICLSAWALGLANPDPYLDKGLAFLAKQAGQEPPPANGWTAALSMVLITLPASLLLFGEEFGWRGWLQQNILPGRPLAAAILTGVIWSLWHLPLNLRGYNYPDSDPILATLVFTGSTIFLSVIYERLRQRTGSIWTPSLAHAATNAIGASLTTLALAGQGDPLFTSYLGVLGWMPLGGFALYLEVTSKHHTSSSDIEQIS